MDRDVFCHVCGDKASGKHYGVPSCDGCRGFFKRSIRRNLEYICKEGGKCIIDVTRRNQCQACRLAKCLRVNMRREAVQHERAPRTSGPDYSEDYVASSSCLSLDFTLIPHPQLLYPNVLHYPAMYSSPSGIPFSINNICDVNPHYGNDNEVSRSEEINDVPKVKGSCTQPLNYLLSKDIYEYASRLLIFTVKWVKSIPAFIQLPDQDRGTLLAQSWNELFILCSIQWTLYAYNGLINHGSHKQDKSIIEFQEKLKIIVRRFQILQVDYTEFACLRALVLFKPDTNNLQDQFHIEMLQEQAQIMLQEYCATRNSIRFGKLLMLLSSIGHFDSRTIQILFFSQINTPFETLILDILKK